MNTDRTATQTLKGDAMTFTTTLAADLTVGTMVRLGETSRAVVAVSAPTKGNVFVLLDGIGDWEVNADFPVTVVGA